MRSRQCHGRWRVGATLLALTAGLYSAAAGTGSARATPTSTAPSSTAPSATLTVGITFNEGSFSPFLNQDTVFWPLMYSSLTTYSAKDFTPAPDLATSWSASDGGTTWTYRIRGGLQWSDGQPLTATDVVYTYHRILQGATESTNWIGYLNQVQTVTAPDATTVVLRLKKPNSQLPQIPIPILPEHVWKHVNETQVKSYSNAPKDGQPVVGSGPYLLQSGQPGGSRYVFAANPRYWGGRPSFSQVIWQVYGAQDALVDALKTGEVDFAENLDPLQIKALSRDSNIHAQMGTYPSYDGLSFNTGAVNTDTSKSTGNGNPVLKDPKFRHALGFAIDRDRLAATVYQGAAVPAQTIIPPAYSQWHYTPPPNDAFTFDLAKAGELLDAAGYRKGSNGKRLRPDGKPIGTLRLLAFSAAPVSIGTMQYVKRWLDQLGLDARIVSMADAQVDDVVLNGEYDIKQTASTPDPDPDSELSYATCAARSGLSDSWYCNPQYDELYRKQGAETDLTKRVQEVMQMQKMLLDDAPRILTEYGMNGEAYRTDRVHCFSPQPDPGGSLLFQSGGPSYLTVRPASERCSGQSATSAASADSSDSAKYVVGGLVLAMVALVMGGGVGWFAGYRKASVDFRD